ncbi:MAG: cupin domain-containing protein [Rhodospirillaceae bacterium]|nr:cupin domain-containing protein [Rhodospirillaceae bacterium]
MNADAPDLKRYPIEIAQLPKYWGEHLDITGLKCTNGWQLLFSQYKPGFKLGDHTHETENLGVVLDGEFHMTIGGRTHVYKPGDWYRVPANTVHSAYYPVASRAIDIWMHRPGDAPKAG